SALPVDDSFRFQTDRISFKIYSCQLHLKNLKDFDSKYNDLLPSDVRISIEIEIESFISQMIGTVDSLLFKINAKFRLSIPVDNIEIDKVQSALSSETKSFDLLNDLYDANREGNWYWIIRQLRNYSLDNSLISQDAFELLANYTKSNTKLIPYLEQSLNHLEKLIENIRIKEPLLQ
ncbi:MAG TPA: hypothetical protein VE619_03565, partial [Nitrososphaeraceae archaeon]|nr:hypothetical protein [Nitrososphaeraceae archaeon]